MSDMKPPKTSRHGENEINEALNANQKRLHGSADRLLSPYRDLVTEAVAEANKAYKDLNSIVREAQRTAAMVRGPAYQALRNHQDSVAEIAREHDGQVGSILEAARLADRIFQLPAINLDSAIAEFVRYMRLLCTRAVCRATFPHSNRCRTSRPLRSTECVAAK